MFCLDLGHEGVISHGGVLFWEKCVGGIEAFAADKEEAYWT